jgi:hypothetical protein
MVNLSPSVLNPKYSNFEIEEWEDEETEDDETSPSTPTQRSSRKMYSTIRHSPRLRRFPIFINTAALSPNRSVFIFSFYQQKVSSHAESTLSSGTFTAL